MTPERSGDDLMASDTTGVVLMHGIARTSRSLRVMQRALRAESFATLNLDYDSRRKSLQQLVDEIHPAVEDFLTRFGGSIHFVGHSMGGLLTRAYLASRRPERLGRVVMLGAPNNGSEVADLMRNLGLFRWLYGPAGQQMTTHDTTLKALPPVDYPLGIIAGNRTVDPVSSTFVLPRPNDGKVSVASTRLAGMSAHIVVGASHPMLVRKKVAIAQTIAFLRNGRFD